MTGPHLDLWIARGLCLGPVALAFPLGAWAVNAAGVDRNASADALAAARTRCRSTA
jgi:hypothetical protein